MADREPGLDLSEEQQRRVQELYSALDSLSFYDLLEVERTANKTEIKRAYYARARTLHPDRFFGKRLGPFKRMLNVIAARINHAYEILSSTERRAQYDAAIRANRASLVEALLDEVAQEMAGAAESSLREEFLVLDVFHLESDPPPPSAEATVAPATRSRKPERT